MALRINHKDNSLQFDKIVAPATPPAGTIVLYFGTDGKLYFKDETGTEVEAGRGIATVSEDLTPALGGNLSVGTRSIIGTDSTGSTAGGNVTLVGGNNPDTGFGGDVNLTGGTAVNNGGGDVNITSGNSANSASGHIILKTGTAVNNGGSITLSLGSGTASGDVIITSATAASGFLPELQFKEATTNGTNHVAFRAPSSVTTNRIWTLPTSDPATANGLALVTDASGNLSFSDNFVNNTGDTITGELTVQVASGAANISLRADDNLSDSYTSLKDGAGVLRSAMLFSQSNAEAYWDLRDAVTGTVNTRLLMDGTGNVDLSVGAAAPVAASNLTRKDYVDGNFVGLAGSESISGEKTFANHTHFSGGSASLTFDTQSAPDGYGYKRITCNDGGGNFNIHSGVYYSGSHKATQANSGGASIIFSSDALNGAISMKTGNIVTNAGDTLTMQTNITMSYDNVTFASTMTQLRWGRDPANINDLTRKSYVDGVSDIRAKDNIVAYTNAIDDVKQMDFYSYTLNEKSHKPGTNTIGLMAQDLQQIRPELVHTQNTDDDTPEADKLLYIDYEGLLGMALQSIKELTAKVEELEQRITDGTTN